ncbi:MAG: IgGFc-binding protein [Kofleriaceae bacterium]
MRGLALCLLISVVACGPARRGDDFGDDDGGSGSNHGSNAGTSCSSDLHDVLDDNGNIVATCPPEQGCADGQCVDACAAAAASQGSVGCDFTVATPSFYATIAPPCFAVFIANNWPKDAAVTISRGGQTYDATTFGRVPNGSPTATTWPAVPASGVATASVGVLFLSSDPSSVNGGPLACPVTPAVSQAGGTAVWTNSATATGMGVAWHITTSFPVSAYDILPYGGAISYLPSAELVLPTSAWGTNYVTAGPIPSSGPAWGQLLASTDATTVQITPKAALPAGTGVVGAPANVTTSYSLNAGQYIQWQNSGDMAGSVIQSDHPVSFTGGTGYLCLTSATSTGGGCDSGHQMIPPVSALGSEYVAPPYATRRSDLAEESIKYRIVGAADGTSLVYSPPVAAGPATINVGQVLEFEATGPFTITSQDAMHPFYVGQYMSGCFVTSGSRPPGGCLGDEEYVNILPPAQWLSSYVFFTDPTYTTTNLVVVRKNNGNGFQDVTIDCLGVIGNWKPIGTAGQYEITNVDLQRGTPVGTCTNGLHTAGSGGPFNIMVWGLSDAASYAYPAGGNVGKINPVVVIGKHS